MQVIAIGTLELILATGFIFVSGGLALCFQLGLTRSLIIATLRTYAQLLALGLVLSWIFQIDNQWLVLAVFALMMLIAAQTVVSRLGLWTPRIVIGSLAGVVLSAVTVTFAVTALLIQVEPWYEARYVLPIAGMVVGNAMNGIALSQERLLEGFQARRGEVLLRLSLGATAWEASLPLIQGSFRAGMIPTLNAMATVGLVSIPGMMTGQVLAGVEPMTGAAYQIVVMLMLSCATALGSIICMVISYRHAFDDQQRLVK
ncbi:MAG: iron export ABC transporter permease subunit FetB [SAR324 cluster bacterium]|nr:iron export ABC transporter permease subunit FetB [SAR324 cluster bacterium]